MQNIFVELLKTVNIAAEKSNPENEGDYQKDGLLYCKQCHTPKQCKIDFEGATLSVACLCRCKEDDIKNGKAEDDRIKRENNIYNLRREALPDSSMRNWTFAKGDNAPLCMRVAKAYVKDFEKFKADGKGVLFYGKVGTGKTYAAVCAANALIDKCIPCLVTSFTRLYNEQQENFNERQRFIDGLSRYKLLVIDDFGAERETEAMNELVHSVIDARCNSGLPIIVTTNLSLSDFRSASQERQRVYSRLYKMCAFVEIKGDDRRAQEYKNTVDELKTQLGIM